MELLNLLRHKRNIWKVIKDDLVLKYFIISFKPKIAFSADNRRIWRFLLRYSITVGNNRLGLEQWTKRWMTVLSSKIQNEQSEVWCLQNKKAFN